MNPLVSWLHLSMLLHAIAFSFQSATNGVFFKISGWRDETVKNVYENSRLNSCRQNIRLLSSSISTLSSQKRSWQFGTPMLLGRITSRRQIDNYGVTNGCLLTGINFLYKASFRLICYFSGSYVSWNLKGKVWKLYWGEIYTAQASLDGG